MKPIYLCTLLFFSGIITMTLSHNNSLLFEQRPWGSYTVLDSSAIYKVKRIEVLPNKRLSYQKHNHRAEYWTIITGSGAVTLDDAVQPVTQGDTIFVPIKAAHRIENTGNEPLIFIEVQIGDYLGEDDIIRIEDDFGRADQRK